MRAGLFDGESLTVVDDMEVRDVGPGEVSVRIQASGVCQSDLSVVSGKIPFVTPVVLGHEGAGIVDAVGAGVTHVSVGDHIALATLTNCGTCAACARGLPTMCRETFGVSETPFQRRGTPVHAFAAVSTFSEKVVVKAVQAVPIPKDVPFESAALIGCGVLTGVGAALNRARVQTGDTVAVIGSGGIGLNVIQGSRIARASKVIVIDANPDKEKAARQFGATDFIDARDGDVVAAVMERTGGLGVDHAFECVGSTELERQAVDMLNWHGQAILLGVPAAGAELSVPVTSLYLDKSILGCRYGSSRPAADIPKYVDLYQSGQLLLDELVSKTYEFEQIHDLIADMKAGVLNRGVLKMKETV